MGKKFIVIDQNYLRDSHLVKCLMSDSALVFVLPDVALMEMCKSNLWKTTMNRSLKVLAGNRHKVYLSIGMGEAIRYEINKRRSIEGRLFNKDLTASFRDLLNEIARNEDGERIEAIAEKIVQVQEELKTDELNGDKNKSRLKDLIGLLELEIKPESLKDLRANRVAHKDKLSTIKEYAPSVFEKFFRQAGFPGNKVKGFLRQKPMILRYVYSRLWLCLYWIEKGGIDTVRPEKITNDYLDHDYILTATFFDGILSKEKRVNEAYRDISSLIA
jgi:hypothetical protein